MALGEMMVALARKASWTNAPLRFGRGRLWGASCRLFVAIAAVSPVHAQPSATETLDQALCRLIESSARSEGLPAGFFTRVIWRESSFRTDVTSRAGAQGVAQFMPGTAAERGLANPFDPEQAIPESARLLSDLRQRFGNLGLAAAAYNGGPTRVASWLAGRDEVRPETRQY